jgi:uncharacterized membrane protein
MDMENLGVLAILSVTISTIFWMVVAWRIMRAHENIAESLKEQNIMQRRRDNARRSNNTETENK